MVEENGRNHLEALVADRGRGLGDLDQILKRASHHTGSKGSGLFNARKLVDLFEVDSSPDKGTRVTLRRRLPASAPPITKNLLDKWEQEFEQEVDISPYAEIKRQNMQLIELLEQLHLRNLETEQQLREIRRLNSQLHLSNREIKDLLEERDRKNLLLQQINEDLDAFAHTVSHDLRSPLQNIDGLTNALESCLETGNPEEAHSLFPMLRGQSAKMNRLITGILAYSLAGHHNLRKQVVDVQALLQQVIASLYVPPAFRIQVQPTLPMLYTQEVYLYQIFSNLIGNAIKYHDRPHQGCIDIYCQFGAEELQFVVQDNGPGVLHEHQQQIFKTFETGGQNLGHSYSTGLGLAIVQKITTNKKGRVWVESEGRGARFLFTWPVSEVVPEEES
ncbi:hypothetical protein BH24BAC1_BH24BAC1_01210 [soil metagenome]